MPKKQQSKRIALTTKTLCMAKGALCPSCITANVEGWDCTDPDYGCIKLDEDKQGFPKRHKQCLKDFGKFPLYLTAMEER